MSPYDEGWDAGYNNKYARNPYKSGTEEYNEWKAGYEAGRDDC